MTKNNILITAIMGFCVLAFALSQDCESGYTYYSDFGNATVYDDSNCFSNTDLGVLNNLIEINGLNYDSILDLGIQTWVGNRLLKLVATWTENGIFNIDQKLSELPNNIGDVTQLEELFLEEHNLTSLPESFSDLINLELALFKSNSLVWLPENIGNIEALKTLDIGYNKLTSVPESIGNLSNLEYLWLFNNELTALYNSICNLNLNWDDINSNNQPYFAIGGNYLCDSELIPDCVENSTYFNSSLEESGYTFILDAPQNCCPSIGDINGDGGYNVLDIVTLANCVLEQNCVDIEFGCAGDVNGDGLYNVLDIVTLANCVLAQNCSG